MFIVHNDMNGITNIDNVTRICLNGRYIHAYVVDGSNHLLGSYTTPEAAQEAFENIIDELAGQTSYSVAKEE